MWNNLDGFKDFVRLPRDLL